MVEVDTRYASRKPLIAMVYTYNMNNEVVKKHKVELSKREARDWLFLKHMIWAVTNGHYVEIINIEDDKEEIDGIAA